MWRWRWRPARLFSMIPEFAVENVSIQQALTLCVSDDDAHETTVQMILTPRDTGYGWEIFSRAEDSAWTLHASGNIVLRNGQHSEAPLGAGLTEVQARCQTPADVASRYQQSREEGIDYGPAFQGLERLFRGDGEALGHIRLSEELAAEVGDYKLHPVLLDACLQVGGSILPNEPSAVYLPTGIERLTLFEHSGGPTSLWCHAKTASQTSEATRRIDFDLFDEHGKRVAQLSGLSLWSVSRRALLGNRARTDWLYRVDWQPVETGGTIGLCERARQLVDSRRPQRYRRGVGIAAGEAGRTLRCH